MAHIHFFNVPSAGHFNATLPVVRELVQRGHQVTYYLTESYRQPVQAAGADFVAYPAWLGDDFFEVHGVDGSNPIKTAALMIEASRHLLQELLPSVRAQQPDLIVFDSMCPWGWQFAQVLGVPHASSMTLLVMPSSLIITSGMLPHLFSILGASLPLFAKFVRAARQLQREYGLRIPPIDRFLNYPGQVTVNYTSRYFQPQGDKMLAAIKFVGPQLAAPPAAMAHELPGELDERPLIYVSLGTVINQNLDFFREVISAFTGAPYQVLLSIGRKNDPAAFGRLPDNVLVRPFVSQVAVLQRAAVFITHAGMNSVQEGLYSNVPLLLVPQQIEQRLVARRVVQLGAGLMSDHSTVPAAALRAMVTHLLSEPSFKANAAKVGASLREAGGAPLAADELLALVQQTKKTA